jgi:uncharacterized RmlC-like cupin family protein
MDTQKEHLPERTVALLVRQAAAKLQVLDLHAGDLAYFAADVTHSYANVSAVPCSYYVAALIMRPRLPAHRTFEESRREGVS